MTSQIQQQALRNPLFVPATNSRALAKAASLACDALIIDCEDSVAPADKDAARQAATGALAGLGERTVVIRINGLGTEWFEQDIQAVCANAPAALCVPKVESAAEMRSLVATVSQAAGQPIALWAMIETPAGVLAAADIAATPGVECLVFGANDLANDLRIQPVPERANLQYAMSAVVMAARAAGIAVLDSVFNDVSDDPGFAQEAQQGAAWGFDGKTIIHPNQILPARAAFSPTAQQIVEAQELVDAWDTADVPDWSVISVNGRMIEALHVESARRLVALSQLYASIDDQ